MGLLALPLELLYLIKDYVEPAEFPDFALTCRATYEACEERILLHNCYRRAFRSVNVGATYSSFIGSSVGFGNPLSLLSAIWKDPLVAHYIEELNIHYTMPVPNHELVVEVAESDGFSELLENSEVLIRAGEDIEMWKANFKDASVRGNCTSCAILVFLSISLPNLRKANLRTSGTCRDAAIADKWFDCLRKVNADVANGNWIPKRFMPFSKLSEIQLGSMFPLQTVMEFATLPSVKTITSFVNRTSSYMTNWSWPQSAPRSLVTRLDLRFVDMPLWDIKNMLDSMPLLKTFNWCVMRSFQREQPGLNPADVISVLAETVGQTIEELCINEPLYFMPYDTSFKVFSRLRVLEIDSYVLFSGKPIADMLPPSLQELNLICLNLSLLSQAAGRMESLYEERSACLPNLQKIDLSCSGWLTQNIDSAAELASQLKGCVEKLKLRDYGYPS